MRRTTILAATAGLVLLLAPGALLAQTKEDARIAAILKRTPLFDGHNDLPWALRENFASDPSKVDLNGDTTAIASPLHTDMPRLRKGGVGAQFWSVYVPASYEGEDAAKAVFEQIDLTKRLVAQYPGTLALARTAEDVVRIHKQGKIASLIGIEGGYAIADSLALLREFRRAGVGYMTLTHSKTTSWADSGTDAPRHGGLSPFGEAVVREMNRIGMLVDLSHVSPETMQDALAIATAPVIFSHSSVRALTNHPRNVPDEVLRLLPANGGVVMVTFVPPFVSEEVRAWEAARTGERARLAALHPEDAAAVEAGMAAWGQANSEPRATLAQVADHIEHVRRMAGIDHVAIGSDFDGIGSTPEGLDGVEDYPALLAELARRGWTDADLRKLAGENLLRVMRAAEAAAVG